MRRLCEFDVDIRHCRGRVSAILWEGGDPFPTLGPEVGVDTETELITDVTLFPKVVVLGCFDPRSMTCWIVYWRDIPEFMQGLCSRNIQQRYFNLGFDEGVIDNEDPDKNLMEAIDKGRVRDMQIRIHLDQIATLGYIQAKLHSLAGCVKYFLNYEMDKGDGTENSARMSFRRLRDDGIQKEITLEQAKYLSLDCICTWALGAHVRESPVEVGHTKGMCVLAHISANGFPVDKLMFAYFEKILKEDMDKFREELMSFGYPDPYKSKTYAESTQPGYSDEKEEREVMNEAVDALLELTEPVLHHTLGLVNTPSKNMLRRALCYMWNHSDAPDEVGMCAENLQIVLTSCNKALLKQEKAMYDELLEEHGLLAFDKCSKPIVMQSLVARMLEDYARQAKEGLGTTGWKGLDFDAAVAAAGEHIDSHPYWTSNEKLLGPKQFFQEYAQRLLDNNPTLELDRTPNSGDIKLTKTDTWRLDDVGISDRFLDAYTNFKHCQKYLSSYMKHEFIKSDGRVHPRFVNVLRTGRTSCSTPNLQQLPSREKRYQLKLMYRAPPGAVLCATDYSFIESHGSLAA